MRICILPIFQSYGRIWNEESYNLKISFWNFLFFELKIVWIFFQYFSCKITKEVNKSHFHSLSWKAYVNITHTELFNSLQVNHQEFSSLVTCTVDGKLKNKLDDSMAICICKVGNAKLYAFIGLLIISMISMFVFFHTYFSWSYHIHNP